MSILNLSTLGSIVFSTILISIVPFLLNRAWLFIKRQSFTYRRALDLPVVNLESSNYAKAKTEWKTNPEKYLKLGLEEYRANGFQIYTDWGFVAVLPESLVDELHRASDTQIEYSTSARMLFGGFDWTSVEVPPWMHRALTRDLLPRQAKTIPLVADEAKYCIPRAFADVSDEWVAINVLSKIYHITASVTARLFVGPILCRNEKWIGVSIQHTVDLVAAGKALKPKALWRKYWDVYVRPIPEIQRIHTARTFANTLLVPIIEERTKKLKADKTYPLPEDVITWVIRETSDAPRPVSSKNQAIEHLGLTLAGTHTQSTTIVNCLYDLAAYPQYMGELREEIDEAYKDGIPNVASLSKLSKLDSFIKESQRMHPAGFFAFVRRVIDPAGLTLSSGLHLPVGSVVSTSRYSTNYDPALYDSPTTFQPFRFHKIRASDPKHASRYLLPAITPTTLSFGYGRHACPGRFLAANIMKIILAEIILNYDIKAPEQWNGKRIENLQMGDSCIPNPRGMVMMRKRL